MLRRLRPPDTVQPIFALEFFPKNRFLLSCIFFLLCFWLDPKAPKDQALRKVAGAATCARRAGTKDCAVLHTRSGRSHKCRHSFRSFRSAIPQAESLLNEKRGIQIAINHCCAKRTTDSALRKSGKKNGRRLRRRKRGRKPSAVPRLFRPADTFGATFLCQKVVNLLLAGKTESKVRGYFPKNRSGNFSLLKILFLVLLVRSKWGNVCFCTRLIRIFD